MYKRGLTLVILSILILANLGATTQAETQWDLFAQDSPLEPRGTIRGYVFLDTNQNGVFEWPQEQGLPLVDVTIRFGVYQHTYCTGGGDPWGNVPGPGSYGPTPLPSGSWTVTMHVPAGYSATTPTEQVAFVPAGGAVTNVNFGLYGSGSIVSAVCHESVGLVQGNGTSVAMGGAAGALLPNTGNQPQPSHSHQLALIIALAGFMTLVGTPWCIAQVKQAYKRWW